MNEEKNEKEYPSGIKFIVTPGEVFFDDELTYTEKFLFSVRKLLLLMSRLLLSQSPKLLEVRVLKFHLVNIM